MARFKSKEIARNVMCSLHQIRVLNHYLSVKYAEHGGLVESLPDPKCISSLAIGTLACLMQEGRMKGQAFITFSSIAAAERALIETNGIVLDDKPLVVVFGKVPPPTAAAKKMVITPIIEGNS